MNYVDELNYDTEKNFMVINFRMNTERLILHGLGLLTYLDGKCVDDVHYSVDMVTIAVDCGEEVWDSDLEELQHYAEQVGTVFEIYPASRRDLLEKGFRV